MSAQKHSWYAVNLLMFGHFFNDFYANFLPILLPVVMPKLGLSLTISGLLMMVLSFTSNVLQPIFGYLLDKKNLNTFLIYSVPFGAILICFIGIIDTTLMLFLLVGLSGLSISFFHPLGSSLVSKVTTEKKLGLSISFFVAGGNLGFALAPVIIVYFTSLYGLESLPLLIIPSIFWSIAIYFSKLNTLNSVQERTTKSNTSLRHIFTDKNLLKLNIAMGMRAWTHVAVSTFLPVLLVSNGHSNTFSGIMLTIFLVGAAIGGLLGGYISDRIGYKKVIIASMTLGVLPTWFFLSSSDITPLTLTALFLCGAGLQGSAPSSLVWAQKMLPNNAGMASGMMLGLAFGIGGIGTAITGALGDYIGLSTALLLTTLPLALGAIIAFTIPDKIKTI